MFNNEKKKPLHDQRNDYTTLWKVLWIVKQNKFEAKKKCWSLIPMPQGKKQHDIAKCTTLRRFVHSEQRQD